MIRCSDWRAKLEEFDLHRILPSIRNTSFRNDLFEELTKDARAVENGKLRGIFPKFVYDQCFDTEIEGLQAKVSALEFIGNPHIPNGKIWGYKVAFNLGDSGNNRSLSVVDSGTLSTSPGPRVYIDNDETWCRVKYDIEVDVLLGKGYFLFGEGLYDHVAQLIQLSQECDLGLHFKPLEIYKSGDDSNKFEGRLLLGGHHTYPCFKKDMPIEEQMQKLTALYEKGKQMFGDAFFINFEAQGVVKEGAIYDYLQKICRDIIRE